VIGGEAGRLGARVQTQLAVDRAKVPIDGAGTEEELLGHLGVGQPGCDQAQDSGLPGAEPGGVGLWGAVSGVVA
jgi:hypothetical protein